MRACCLILPFVFVGCRTEPGYFVDAAAEQGLEFISYSGDRLWYLIDTLGAGVAAGDYDGDGDADLYWLSGHAILDSFQEEASSYRDALWRNDGDGRFTDVTGAARVGRPGWSNGAVFADYDGDGDLDLYVVRHGPNLLYRNEGDGSFAEVGERAGVADPGYGTGACFADLDHDGDLDLYVAIYAHFVIEEQKGKVKWFTDGVKQFPQYFDPQDNVLYRNEGDGTFTDITALAGAQGTGRSLGVLATDHDDDGDLDIFVANDIGFNNLLRNDHGRFTDVALPAGVACNAEGLYEASMGVAGADYDNDGDIDLIVTNYGGELNTLYRNEGGGYFLDATREAGLDSQAILDSVGWGVGFHDFDLDTRLDLLVVNGHVSSSMVLWYMRNVNDGSGDIPQMGREAFNAGARQSKLLFLGASDGRFRDVSAQAGYEITSPRMSRGAAFADFDLDGRMDVAVSNKNERAQVLLNRLPRRGGWVEFRLEGKAPNRFAIGARVRIEFDEPPPLEPLSGSTSSLTRRVVLTREVHAGTSYLSGSDLGVHFGLGRATAVSRVEVRWPDRGVERFEDVPINARVTLVQGEGEGQGKREGKEEAEGKGEGKGDVQPESNPLTP